MTETIFFAFELTFSIIALLSILIAASVDMHDQSPAPPLTPPIYQLTEENRAKAEELLESVRTGLYLDETALEISQKLSETAESCRQLYEPSEVYETRNLAECGSEACENCKKFTNCELFSDFNGSELENLR